MPARDTQLVAVAAVWIAAACSSPGRSVGAHASGEGSNFPLESKGRAVATLTGTVALKGAPVPYFTVSTGNFTMWQSHPLVVHNKDGQLKVRVEPTDNIDVVISGPGFARKVIILEKHLEPGDILDLGRIEVSPGFTIKGKVVDAQGTPVPRAEVRIDQSGIATENPALRMANGDFWTETDAGGAYQIEGVTRVDLAGASPRIWAALGTRASVPKALPAANLTIDLVIVLTGAIDGSIEDSRNDTNGLGVLIRSLADRDASLLTNVSENGTFHIERVPEGSYEVRVMERRQIPAQRITVTPGTIATVVLREN